MDCLQLQLQPHQLRTQPFHYLISEQAKSLVALQELQNEVGALLEFRDLVMETFPNLRQKMSVSNSHTFSSPQNYLPLSGSLNSRHWEPGIKVKRKIVNKAENESSFGRVRSNSHGSKIQSSQPKSSEAISGVQDSGFSTETNSSNKDHASNTATSVPLPVVQTDDPFLTRKENTSQKDCPREEYDRSDEDLSEDGLILKVNEAEEELWNLLDVIHTKGTKLREEVETLQLRLMVDEIESHLRTKDLEMRKVGGRKFRRRCRSLENVGDGFVSVLAPLDPPEIEPVQANFKLNDFSLEENVFGKKRTRSITLEDVDHIRHERNMLLEKLAEMEAENVASRIKTSELQNEISALISTKEELQEQLFQAVKQKTELNSKIHELHMKFVGGDKKWKTGLCLSPSGGGKVEKLTGKDSTDSESSQSSLNRSKSSDDAQIILMNDRDHFTNRVSLMRNLSTLEAGLISEPKERKKVQVRLTETTRKKLAAILKEKNYLQLQRHLLVSVVQNQILSSKLESSAKSKDDLFVQLDKYKRENDELLFRLEERNIELEGTRAQVRVLEKLQHQSKGSYETRTESGIAGKKSGENFTFLENDHLRSKGFSESEITRARQIFLESQNKKVDKSELARVVNRTKNSSALGPNDLNNSFDIEKSCNVIPILALPLPAMVSHQSSGTESTHALEISSELEADMLRADKCESLKTDKSPYRRRPSKIPLNIQKTSKSLKPSLAEGSSASYKKSDSELNKSLKKCSLENALQNSIVSRTTCQTPLSIKYNSGTRTGSQLSIASQKSHTSSSVAAGGVGPGPGPGRSDKRKSLTCSQKEENSLMSSSGKSPSLKPGTNFSQVRQRDTLTRKNQNESCEGSGVAGSGGKRTLRSSFRDSFRSKISIDGNVSGSLARRDASLSNGRKDSLQQKQNRTNSVQQKINLNKTIVSTEGGDNTKLDKETPKVPSDKTNEPTGNGNDDENACRKELDSSELFVDSLNSPTKSSKIEFTSLSPPTSPLLPPPLVSIQLPSSSSTNLNLLDVVRESFQRRLAEKFSWTLFKNKHHGFIQNAQANDKNVWKNSPQDESSQTKRIPANETEEIQFFDSINDSFDVDKDDSLLMNTSSHHWNKSLENEVMAELDSLEMKSS